MMIMMCITLCFRSYAQAGVLDVIKAGIIKAIKAVDLKIQRMQNETIRMQNAQKLLETSMSETKLGEIGGWMAKQKELYRSYFEELSTVRNTIAYSKRVREIINSQLALVEDYKKAIRLIKFDQHFTASEINRMRMIYEGILNESIQNLDEIQSAVQSFLTTMTDGQRLAIIYRAGNAIDENKNDLHRFTQENMQLALQRAKDRADVSLIKKMYGL